MSIILADSHSVEDELVIPASCFEVKAIFRGEPDRDTVREIQEWVRNTGLPHEWRGHTHTKPPADGPPPKYIDEFDVPTKGRKVRAVAPCPCCSPRHAKYKLGGKIAWFKDEGVIRLIGPRCYASLNADGHKEAMAEMTARKRREQAIRYLSENLPRLEVMYSTYEEFRKIAFAVEGFRTDLLAALESLDIPLWNHCQQGTLSIFQKTTDISVTKAGEIKQREIDIKVPYATLRGHLILEPQPKSFDMTLNNVRTGLSRIIDQIRSKPNVAGWSDEDRRLSLMSYNRTRGDLLRLAGRIRDLQQFVGPIALPTLKRWGIMPEATLSIFVERVGREYRIGSSPNNWIKMDILPSMELSVPDFETIDPGIDDG